jgi:hypothetical protein
MFSLELSFGYTSPILGEIGGNLTDNASHKYCRVLHLLSQTTSLGVETSGKIYQQTIHE